MASTINVAIKQAGDSLTAGELNSIVSGANAAITEQNQTKTDHAAAILANSQSLASKVDKVTGKGLSTEDYTKEEKQKLAGLEKLALELTYAQAVAAMAAEELVPGSLYKITDRGDRGIFLPAISTSAFSQQGTRIMLCPATYETGNGWLGIWQDALEPAIGDLVIWGGHVWKNLTGAVGAPAVDWSDITLDDVNWELVSKSDFSDDEYREHLFGIVYDFKNDWIVKQFDVFDNELGDTKDDSIFLKQVVDYCDWNQFIQFPGLFSNNKCKALFNNNSNGISSNYIRSSSITGNIVAMIFDNICPYGIKYNKAEVISSNVVEEISNNEAGIIEYNNISGCIDSNSIIGYNIEYNSNAGSILNNSNAGHILANSNAGDISDNSNTGEISNNSNSGAISNNSNAGNIMKNSNLGTIGSNSNTDDIVNNTNAGFIEMNDNAGVISYNSNAGNIYNNESTILGILHNSNSGDISGNSATTGANISFNLPGTGSIFNNEWEADVTDGVVDKTMEPTP